MVLGQQRECVTVDFYNNIHKKGGAIFSAIDDISKVFTQQDEFSEPIQRSCQILKRHGQAEALAKCLGW